MADEINIVKEGKKAIEKLHEARSKIEEALYQGMEKALLLIERDAKKNCPVRKPKSINKKTKKSYRIVNVSTKGGGLRASITHEIEVKDLEVRGRVGSNKNYAPYVHNGTGKYAKDGNGRKTPWRYKDPDTGEVVWTVGQKPIPFLQDAIDSNKDKIGSIFKEVTDKL